MGNLHKVLYRGFAIEFLPKFIKATMSNILNSPPKNLRNFTKAIFTEISENLSLLAKRCMSLGEKNELIESFNLKIAHMCFTS